MTKFKTSATASICPEREIMGYTQNFPEKVADNATEVLKVLVALQGATIALSIFVAINNTREVSGISWYPLVFKITLIRMHYLKLKKHLLAPLLLTKKNTILKYLYINMGSRSWSRQRESPSRVGKLVHWTNFYSSFSIPFIRKNRVL